MDKLLSNKSNPLELESLRSELIDKSLSTSSNNLRLFIYQKYFEQILSLKNSNFQEAFLKEFLDDYVTCISKFEVWGIELEISKNIIEQLKKVASLKIASENLIPLNSEVDRIEEQLEKLNLILDRKDFEDGETHKAFFPLIDKDAPEGFYGIIESVTVRINKSVDKDKFIIIPSEKEIEKKILEQCNNSWLLALNLSKEYVKKPFRHHEVIISFDRKDGFYEGNSLGIALTLSFLEQLLKFYNPAFIINIKEQSAFTGGVIETGKVLCTGEEIIKRKVAAVFFSEINTFVFPKCEETYANFALTQLKLNYPERKLKLIPVEEIKDVLNRRDVVDIKKQKLIVRSGKFIKKNWVSAIATVLLAILFGYLFVMDWDDNPYNLSTDGNLLFVKNKNGKTLWTKEINFAESIIGNRLKYYAQIVNIDDDKFNELILIRSSYDKENYSQDRSTLICYDKDQRLKWTYTFKDTVSSEREDLSPKYNVLFVDTLSINQKKVLLCFANNETSFSSAIFGLDINSGERINNTLWNSGYTWDGVVIETSKHNMFIGAGADNGYREAVVWGIDIEKLSGFRPTVESYRIRNFQRAGIIFYFRIPKTDFEELNGSKTPGIIAGSLKYDKINDILSFSSYTKDVPTFQYQLKSNFKNLDIFVSDGFSRQRDSLIEVGLLNAPLTDTKEFIAKHKKRILVWQNGEWINYYDKK